jgi:hypothetical protein
MQTIKARVVGVPTEYWMEKYARCFLLLITVFTVKYPLFFNICSDIVPSYNSNATSQ